jgi:hypothetical protein
MGRGIPADGGVLAEMRQADPPVSYLVGTPCQCLEVSAVVQFN